MKDDCFHGLQKFSGRRYWVDETHDKKEMEGCYCIAVEVPDMNHDPMLFTMSVRYHDNEPNNDDKNDKRVALFDDQYTCLEFMGELYFPDKHLRMVKATKEVVNHKLFDAMGAYKVRKPLIQLP